MEALVVFWAHLFLLAFGLVLGTDAVHEVCPCGRVEDCPTLPPYGENRLDLEWFGVHRPCVHYGWVRCCSRNETTGLNLTLSGSNSLQALYGPSRVLSLEKLKCTERHRCEEAYGDKPTDVAVYGAIHHCPTFGHVWCIRLKTKDETDPEVAEEEEDTTAEVELKSLPPRIYVDGNGTLVISGGSPVIYLPTAPALQPVVSTTTKSTAEQTTEPPITTTSPVPTENETDPVNSAEIGIFLRNVGDLARFLLKKNETVVTLDNGEGKIQFGINKNQALGIFDWIKGWKMH